MKPLDLKTCIERPPAPTEFVWPGFPAGTIGALVGPAGVGKSVLALEAAIGVAAAGTGAGLAGLAPRRAGRVVYFAAEDRAGVLARRVYVTCKQLRSRDALTAVIDNLVLLPIIGRDFNILNDADLRQIVDLCGDARLIVLDALPRFHRTESNEGTDQRQISQTLAYIAAHTAASILCLQRTSSSHAAAALKEAATWSAAMAPMTALEAPRYFHEPGMSVHDARRHYVRLDIAGNPYAAEAPTLWYRRSEGGVLRPVTLTQRA